ncbi:MAG: acetyl-CoA C-acetyltransferase, partial [Bacteroidetes bacterium]|nr:acetyl-CoA C-acetyltransferase [Bacteroidota bacterium]
MPRPLSPNDPCLVSVARTPIGSMGGSLAGLSATALGSIAITAALERAGL